ncbi:MAG: recombinase family protein [Chloroflexota bacterium]|nr:recombinase family protein [Chloroflexota bacterium]
MKQPVGYLRKSRVLPGRSDVSWEVQEQKIRELAEQHGDGELLLLSDWNKSGRKGANGRPGYHQLVTLVDEGRVSTLYSYSLSRLGRSVHELSALFALCAERGVAVRLVKDRIDTSTASGRLTVNVLSSVAEFEADVAQERARDTVAARRARGDRIGQVPYGERPGEDLAAILTAYREAGSVIGAARLLNTRGVPTRNGGPWSTTPVREILIRHKAMPWRSRPGQKAAAPFILFRLLRCHCGRQMTGARFRNGPDPAYTVYRCIGGRTDVTHARQSVSERKLLPWVKAEAARFRVPVDRVEIEQRDENRRLELEARRNALLDLVGTFDRAEIERRAAKIDEEIARLDATQRLVDVPPAIDWTWPPKAINEVLRAFWDHVQLNDEMEPVHAEWLVPEWRA